MYTIPTDQSPGDLEHISKEYFSNHINKSNPIKNDVEHDEGQINTDMLPNVSMWNEENKDIEASIKKKRRRSLDVIS